MLAWWCRSYPQCIFITLIYTSLWKGLTLACGSLSDREEKNHFPYFSIVKKFDLLLDHLILEILSSQAPPFSGFYELLSKFHIRLYCFALYSTGILFGEICTKPPSKIDFLGFMPFIPLYCNPQILPHLISKSAAFTCEENMRRNW